MILEFEAFVEIERNMAIASSNEFSGLFSVNMLTGNCEFIDMIPNEKIDKDRLYTKALYVNNKVYFIPYAAKEIAVYNLKTKKVYKISVKEVIDREKKLYRKNAKFNGGIIYKEFVYMIPCTYPGVLRINTNTDCVDYFDDWVNEEPYIFRKSPCIVGSKFYIPSVLDNSVLIFDMEHCKGKIKHIGKSNNGSWSICKNNQELWFAPKNSGSVVRWNLETNYVKEYDAYPENFQGNNFLFTKAFVHESNIYMIPAFANMAIKVDCTTGEIQKFDIQEIGENSIVYFMFETIKEIYLKIVRGTERKYIKISKIDLHIQEYVFMFSIGRDLYEKSYFENRGDLLKEKNCFRLEEFLKKLL